MVGEISTESIEDSANPQLSIDSNDNILVIWDNTTDYAGAGTVRDIFFSIASFHPNPKL